MLSSHVGAPDSTLAPVPDCSFLPVWVLGGCRDGPVPGSCHLRGGLGHILSAWISALVRDHFGWLRSDPDDAFSCLLLAPFLYQPASQINNK